MQENKKVVPDFWHGENIHYNMIEKYFSPLTLLHFLIHNIYRNRNECLLTLSVEKIKKRNNTPQ